MFFEDLQEEFETELKELGYSESNLASDFECDLVYDLCSFHKRLKKLEFIISNIGNENA